MKNDINASIKHFKSYYQNIRNELLSKGQKTTMELSHDIAGNSALENDVIVKINTITAQILHLGAQLEQLYHKIHSK
jgi:hypothetical protein